MKATELRIGNEVLYNGKPISISIVGLREFYYLEDTHANSEIDKRCYEPIPLTEEWLLKLGFEKHYTSFTSPRLKDGRRISLKFENESVVEYSLNYFTDRQMDYVHQLQNLHFFLTGEELEIKETVQ